MNEGDANGASVELDMGAERATRVLPCLKTTWCVEPRDHEGPCVEALRTPFAPPDFGPKRGKR